MECALKEDNGEKKIVTVGKGNIYSVSIGCAMVKEVRDEKQCHYKTNYQLNKNPMWSNLRLLDSILCLNV